MPLKRLERLRATHAGRRLSERERVWVEATESLCALMDKEKVTRAELARRLDVSPAYVTKLLSGTQNLTLATLADAFFELGRSLRVSYGPPTERIVVQTESPSSVVRLYPQRTRRQSRTG